MVSSRCLVHGTVPSDYGKLVPVDAPASLLDTPKMYYLLRSALTIDKSFPDPEIEQLNYGTLWENVNILFRRKAIRNGFHVCASLLHRQHQ